MEATVLLLLCTINLACAAPQYYETPPRADSMPNDIYKDIVKHEPELARDSKILYKNLGALRYHIQDPERADYLIVDRNTRHPNEVSNKDVAAAGPAGVPAAAAAPTPPHHQGPRRHQQNSGAGSGHQSNFPGRFVP